MSLSAIAAGATRQFATGVNLVEVYATVFDARGEPVPGLDADDFVVEEDGRPEQIQTFAAGAFPLSLAIAVDRSFSMPRDRLASVVYATQRLLGELRPDDKVTLLAIGSEVETLSPLSTDHRSAYYAIASLQPWGTTPIFDATVSAISTIQAATGRRALILLTDGVDRYSTLTGSAVLAEARRHDVLVYPVLLRPSPPAVFAELAAASGARSLVVSEVSRLPATLSSIATELRRQYLLGYVPSSRDVSSNTWRTITVRVRRSGLHVRARAGYYAAP